MNNYCRLKAVIDLDAVKKNLEAIHSKVNDDTKMIVVIKADGYGHGAYRIASVFEDADYVWGYAVAFLEEGVALRKEGIKKPILCLGCVFPNQFEDMITNDIHMTLYSEELALEAVEVAKKLNKKIVAHLKIDTGMSRLGFNVSDESIEAILRLCQNPWLDVEGMFTHYATADETDKTGTYKQLHEFLYMKEKLAEKGQIFKYYHCSNSAAIIDMPEQDTLNLSRSGIATYGLYPSKDIDQSKITLYPALELIAHVTFIKWVEKGTPVSYGSTYVTERPTCIATIPTGYGDGYPRSLSNKGYVLIHGKKAPIIGKVCMDQFMVDITDIPDVKFGDVVTLIGKDGDEFLSVETLSDLSGRFNYEFLCNINKRVPREYLLNGKIIAQDDSF